MLGLFTMKGVPAMRWDVKKFPLQQMCKLVLQPGTPCSSELSAWSESTSLGKSGNPNLIRNDGVHARVLGGKKTTPTSHKTLVRGKNGADFLPIVPLTLFFPAPFFPTHQGGSRRSVICSDQAPFL